VCTKTVEDLKGPSFTLAVNSDNSLTLSFNEAIKGLTASKITITISGADFTFTITTNSDSEYTIQLSFSSSVDAGSEVKVELSSAVTDLYD
jgi:molybdopterin-binding protein